MFSFHPDLWGRWAKLTTGRFFKWLKPPAIAGHLQYRIHANAFLDDHLVPSDSVQKGGTANSCQKNNRGDPKMEVQKPRFFRYFAADSFSHYISLYKAYLVRIPPFQVPEMFGDFMNTRICLNSRRVFMMKEILASEFRHHLSFG